MFGLVFTGCTATKYVSFSRICSTSIQDNEDCTLTIQSPQIAPLKFIPVGAAAGVFGEWLFSFITVFAGGIALKVGWKIWL